MSRKATKNPYQEKTEEATKDLFNHIEKVGYGKPRERSMNDWEKEWKKLVKVNFDGLEGKAYGKGETEIKVEILGLVFINKLLTKERQKMAKALRIEKIKIFSFICPKCRHYGEEGKYCPNDRRKLVRESFEYYINSRDEEFNQKLDSYLKKQEGK